MDDGGGGSGQREEIWHMTPRHTNNSKGSGYAAGESSTTAKYNRKKIRGEDHLEADPR